MNEEKQFDIFICGVILLAIFSISWSFFHILFTTNLGPLEITYQALMSEPSPFWSYFFIVLMVVVIVSLIKEGIENER